jgi:hypothetical protein
MVQRRPSVHRDNLNMSLADNPTREEFAAMMASGGIMEFKQGDLVAIRGLDGNEYDGVIIASNGDDSFRVKYRQLDMPVEFGFTEQTTISRQRLMPTKGPFIRINGEVLTDDPSHAGQVGRIIAIGKTLKCKQFFKVKFEDGSENWFSEDRVFVDDAVLEEWNEANVVKSDVDFNHPDIRDALLNAIRNDDEY